MENFNPQLTPGLAVVMSLFAASLWGSWFVALKYLGDYPLDGFIVTLCATSAVFVWIVGLALEGPALAGNLSAVWRDDPARIVVTLACGAIYMAGMRFSLTVMRVIGLSVAQPIQSSMNIAIGTTITVVVGGLPAGVSPLIVALAAFSLIGAVVASMHAGQLRSRTQAQDAPDYVSARDLWRALGLVAIANLMTPAYPLALSFGLRSTTQSHGMAVLPFMAMLATGALIGGLLTAGVNLTRCGLWGRVFEAPFRTHRWGIGTGLFHYGGNIIHTFATGFLSSAVSWPLGLTSGLWTQVWGLVHGEFRGATRAAFGWLFAGIGLYLLGAYLVAFVRS
ncbi:MAG: hypothetical protein HZB53_15565 [Chloroflexi bacterium]|nr:hypothetical protein [Chloroflexota bacterium]